MPVYLNYLKKVNVVVSRSVFFYIVRLNGLCDKMKEETHFLLGWELRYKHPGKQAGRQAVRQQVSTLNGPSSPRELSTRRPNTRATSAWRRHDNSLKPVFMFPWQPVTNPL